MPAVLLTVSKGDDRGRGNESIVTLESEKSSDAALEDAQLYECRVPTFATPAVESLVEALIRLIVDDNSWKLL